MRRILLCCVLVKFGGFVQSQLLGTVRNVHLVEPIPYMLDVMETTLRDMEEYGWCNLKLPDFSVDIDEDVFDWHVKGRAIFSNAFLVSIQQVDIIRNTVQQVWRFDNTDNTTSVFVQATLRMTDIQLGYDIDLELEDGSHHHYTGMFKHNNAQYPFAVIYNMFTEQYSATVTMTALARSTNKMVFAPSNSLTQVLSHSYNVTSASEGMAAWADVFQPLLLDVAMHKVPFPDICYNCPA